MKKMLSLVAALLLVPITASATVVGVQLNGIVDAGQTDYLLQPAFGLPDTFPSKQQYDFSVNFGFDDTVAADSSPYGSSGTYYNAIKYLYILLDGKTFNAPVSSSRIDINRPSIGSDSFMGSTYGVVNVNGLDVTVTTLFQLFARENSPYFPDHYYSNMDLQLPPSPLNQDKQYSNSSFLLRLSGWSAPIEGYGPDAAPILYPTGGFNGSVLETAAMPAPVPEPSTFGLLCIGLASAGLIHLRNRKR